MQKACHKKGMIFKCSTCGVFFDLENVYDKEFVIMKDLYDMDLKGHLTVLRGLGTFAPLNRVFFCFFDM